MPLGESSARRPTIRDVARAAGVSTVTVSRVANDPALVKPATRARVEGVMDRLGYTPNAAARSMRTNVSRTVGFMVPDLTNFPNAAVAKAAEAALAEAGYAMLLTNSDYDPAQEERFLRVLRGRQVDGMILYLSDEDDLKVQATIRAMDVPVVILDRDLPFAVDTVFSEHAAAMGAVVDHLVQRGHRRFGLLVPELRIRPVRERVRAFRAQAEACGLAMDEQVVAQSDPLASSTHAVDAILDTDPRPTVLLVEGTQLLAATFAALRRRRLAVPGEVEVIAMDAVEPLAAAMPEIVGIARDFAEIGRCAAQLLIERLSGARSGPPKEVTLESPAVLARSTGPASVQC